MYLFDKKQIPFHHMLCTLFILTSLPELIGATRWSQSLFESLHFGNIAFSSHKKISYTDTTTNRGLFVWKLKRWQPTTTTFIGHHIYNRYKDGNKTLIRKQQGKKNDDDSSEEIQVTSDNSMHMVGITKEQIAKRGESVHLKLDSSSMLSQTTTTNSSSSSSITDDNKEEEKQNVTLHIYHHDSGKNNVSLYGLGLTEGAFKEWIRYKLHNFEEYYSNDFNLESKDDSSPQPPLSPTSTNGDNKERNKRGEEKFKDYSSSVESKNITINDPKVREKLRENWFAGNLICDRTETMVKFPSEKEKKREEDPENSEKYSDEGRRHKKRGGFEDLLNVYADRLIGMLQDEFERETNKSDGGKNMHNTNSLLHAWLCENYGTSQIKNLEFATFSRFSERKQLELMQLFLNWFRGEFPYYYDECCACGASQKKDEAINTSCNHNESESVITNELTNETNVEKTQNTFLGYIYPTSNEILGKASRTEIYCCHKCRRYTRFPRYNSVPSILNYRRGRCGEYSILLFRILRELGHEARWVVDWSDHVWVECLIGNSSTPIIGTSNGLSGLEHNCCQNRTTGRWVHLDPCEAAVDMPLLYQDWGKKQTFIIAFGAHDITVNTVRHNDGVISNRLKTNESNGDELVDTFSSLIEDVTMKYTTDNKTDIQSRRDESESLVNLCLEKVRERLRKTLVDLRQKGSMR